MFERLQENAGGLATNGRAFRPNELILNAEYAPKIKKFVSDVTTDIRICAYDWRWYSNQPDIDIQKLNIELLLKAKAGRRVRVITNSNIHSNRLRELGFRVHTVKSGELLHTKAISIDTNVLIIGSHNMTKRAHHDNIEMSIVAYDFETILQYNEYFDRMWAVTDES